MAGRGLVISYYFHPTGGGGVQRWSKFIKYLVRFDWHFDVICADLPAGDFSDSSLLDEIPSSTRVCRIPPSEPVMRSPVAKGGESKYWQRWLGSFVFITDSRSRWNNRLRRRIFHELDKINYDILVLSSPPYSLVRLAAELQQQISIPVIVDQRDPWTTNPYKIYPTPLHRMLDIRREKKAIGALQNFVFAYDSHRRYYENTIPGFNKKRALVLTNGYDEEDFTGLQPEKPTVTADLHLAFSGTFYSHFNHPGTLFKALAELKKNGVTIRFHHIGKSAYDLKKLAARFGCEELIEVHGYLEHKNCLRKLAGMDALCLILNEKNRFASQTVGAKLYEYLRFKKPVLALVPENGEAAGTLKRSRAGLVCRANDIAGIKQAVLEIINNRAQFVFDDIELYSRERLAGELAAFFDEIVKAPLK